MTIITKRPFYYTSGGSWDEAPSGWYQWTDEGLVWLGEKLPEDGLGRGKRLPDAPKMERKP